ncbi:MULTISPECIES: copper chaperone PCu(A)C [Lysobacter]|uniref:Copper chaperone PCu(A)C n=1 Tax=Lysobacter firmicutimachus TaxID=1792846 RepID=A0ABU8D5X1_9GAMM|nr:copper chaperone PCu(A)C [Lysobacter antibioticus]
MRTVAGCGFASTWLRANDSAMRCSVRSAAKPSRRGRRCGAMSGATGGPAFVAAGRTAARRRLPAFIDATMSAGMMGPMNASRIAIGLGLALALAAPLSTLAKSPAPAKGCAAQVREGWLRLPPMQMPMMAGFGRIENRCAAPVVIVGAKSAAFGEVSLHETRLVDGVSKMRPVPELRIAPDGAAVLKPGGLHLMLMQPRAPLKAGSRVAVEFALKDGGTLFGEFEVRKPAP